MTDGQAAVETWVRAFPQGHFGAAYAIALAASVLASALTVVYVGTGTVAESNPVVARIIETAGMATAVTARTAAVPAAYWGYYAVASVVDAPGVGRVFAWMGAAINLADAVGNLAVAAAVGLVDYSADGQYVLGLVAVLVVAAVAARPPSRFPNPSGE